MLFFQMEADRKYVNKPIIIDWIEKFAVQDLYEGHYMKIPKRMILNIKSNPGTEFVDIISMPFLLVSQKVKKVMELYEPNLQFKEMILLDRENAFAEEYFLPLLTVKDVLSEKSLFTNNHTILEKAVLHKDKVGDTAVFFADGAPREAGIWRLDIIESLLFRGAKGFVLKEAAIG